MRRLVTNPGVWFGLGQTVAFSVTGNNGLLSPEVVATASATAIGVLPIFLSSKNKERITSLIPHFSHDNWALYVNGLTLPTIVAPISMLYSGSSTGALIAAGFGIGNALKALEIDGKWKRENIRNFLSSVFHLKGDSEINQNIKNPTQKINRVSNRLRNTGNNVLNNLGLPELYTAIGSIAAASLGSPHTQWLTIPSAGLALIFTASAQPAGDPQPSHSVLYGSKRISGLSDQVFARACFLLNNATGSVAAFLNNDIVGLDQNLTALSGGLLGTGNALLLKLGVQADKATMPKPL